MAPKPSPEDFARAFGRGFEFRYIVVDEVTHFEARINKIRALIEHPDTPEYERDAGRRALERLGLGDDQLEQGE